MKFNGCDSLRTVNYRMEEELKCDSREVQVLKITELGGGGVEKRHESCQLAES